MSYSKSTTTTTLLYCKDLLLTLNPLAMDDGPMSPKQYILLESEFYR